MYREKDKYPLIILLKDGLGAGLAIAQACHAAYMFGRDHPNVETNGYVYILRANRKDLHHFQEAFAFEMIPHVAFDEPAMDYETTALSVSCNPNMVKRLAKY